MFFRAALYDRSNSPGQCCSSSSSLRRARKLRERDLHHRKRNENQSFSVSEIENPHRSTSKMTRQKRSATHGQTFETHRHSIAVQVLESVLNSIRKSHDMQQMLNQYR
jgi:hypothetical protein